ncbi:MAG TPA: efflux RND transporter permease subunit [Sediminispirochaeta sp.]|nr:efflux RND transporter permease subunit [Sediminispirochaeta sp.]
MEELRQVILRSSPSLVRLSDIAEVEYRDDDSASRVFIDGMPGIYIQIQNESGSNSVQVARAVRRSLSAINNDLPEGIELRVLSDTTTMIRSTLEQVARAALQGALLAMLVLFVFLRNIKGTFIIGLAIPISILITLMFMSLFDLTLNLLTLTGLVLGLGMIVDGSIVILENIHEYRKRGAKPSTAAILGSHEMYRAIVSSTATTLCVFIPVIIFQNELEMMGQLFEDLVFTVVISLLVSLAVALIVVPALAGPIMGLNTRIQKPLKNPLLRGLDRFMEDSIHALETGYQRALDYCLSHRTLVLLTVFVILIYSLLQFGSMGMNLFVRGGADDEVEINVTLPTGTHIDETQRIMDGLQEEIQNKVRGYETIIMSVGSGRRFWGSGGGNEGSIQINLPPPEEQVDGPTDIRAKLDDYITSIPGAQIEFRAGRRMGGSSPIEIEVLSDNQEAAFSTAESIRNILHRRIPEVRDPVISLEEGSPQLRFRIDRHRAALLGISPAAIAREIRTAVSGTRAGSLNEGGEERSIELRLRAEDVSDLPDLEALFLPNNRGDRIPLGSIARIEESTAPADIDRENQQRVIEVTADLVEGVAATEMQEIIRSTVEEYLIPEEGVSIVYSGEAGDVERFSISFLIIIISAIVLVFGVMASLFESFVDPFIIFFSIPLVFIGVIWIYIFSGEPFSLFSAVGVVALVGIVVNNGIVLVDYTNTLRQRGMAVRQACLAAGRSRLQPILMTTLTTILGMVPLAFFPGEGAETVQPIGKTMVGGLSVGAFMTLFVTPVMYSILNRRHDLRRSRDRDRLKKLEESLYDPI